MHMADALISPAVGLSMGAVSALAIGLSVAKVKKDELSEKKIPIMGVAGAMVFAGQMINFTIPATGSSGHIGGGILLAGLLGGAPAFLSLTAVLVIQCLFFADGGLLALGCNIFNMGAVPCLIVYPLLFKTIINGGAGYKRLSFASIVSVVAGLLLGAFGVVLETLTSGITELPFGLFAALMLSIHLVIGIVEGIITATALCFVYKMRPEIIDALPSVENPDGVSIKKVLATLVILTIITAGALSMLSSKNPDGLEWALGKVTGGVYGSETYPENAAETSVAGLVGAAGTFVLAGSAGLIITKIKKRKRTKTNV